MIQTSTMIPVISTSVVYFTEQHRYSVKRTDHTIPAKTPGQLKCHHGSITVAFATNPMIILNDIPVTCILPFIPLRSVRRAK